MFLGTNIFLALLRAYFNPYLTAIKLSQSRAHNIIITVCHEHKLYCFIIITVLPKSNN